MATTLRQAFRQFRSNLELTDAQQKEVATSHQVLRAYLCNQFVVVSDFLTGSYGRQTLIRPSRDVDLLLVLDNHYWYGTAAWPGYGFQQRGPSNLLSRVKEVLMQRYPRSDIGQDGQAVTVSFRHIDVDVVPAFLCNWGGYLIANTPGNNWLRADPEQHRSAVLQLNANRDLRFVPLVKMVKYWNYSHTYGLSGFFLEMLAHNVFTSSALAVDGEGVVQFFDCAVHWIDNWLSVTDPATGENLMPRFINTPTKRSTARYRFNNAASLAHQALDAANQSDRHEYASRLLNSWIEAYSAIEEQKRAIELWGRLFGGLFPSYG